MVCGVEGNVQLHHSHKEENQLFLTYEDEILMNYILVEGVYDRFGVFVDHDSSSLTNEKDHHYFLNSADVCW